MALLRHSSAATEEMRCLNGVKALSLSATLVALECKAAGSVRGRA